MSNSGWIGVDLDGTLAEYHGWNGGAIGEPIPRMAARVRQWLDEGQDVRIFTARVWTERAHGDGPMTKQIEAWCIQHFGKPLPVTCMKDYAMIELWDDRAVQVIPNTGRRADGQP